MLASDMAVDFEVLHISGPRVVLFDRAAPREKLHELPRAAPLEKSTIV